MVLIKFGFICSEHFPKHLRETLIPLKVLAQKLCIKETHNIKKFLLLPGVQESFFPTL